jgi:hypothetical protein
MQPAAESAVGRIKNANMPRSRSHVEPVEAVCLKSRTAASFAFGSNSWRSEDIALLKAAVAKRERGVGFRPGPRRGCRQPLQPGDISHRGNKEMPHATPRSLIFHLALHDLTIAEKSRAGSVARGVDDFQLKKVFNSVRSASRSISAQSLFLAMASNSALAICECLNGLDMKGA